MSGTTFKIQSTRLVSFYTAAHFEQVGLSLQMDLMFRSSKPLVSQVQQGYGVNTDVDTNNSSNLFREKQRA